MRLLFFADPGLFQLKHLESAHISGIEFFEGKKKVGVAQRR